MKAGLDEEHAMTTAPVDDPVASSSEQFVPDNPASA
jgi:hypothetical protein